jgi:nicotinate-nucleotide adenylyltransferase
LTKPTEPLSQSSAIGVFGGRFDPVHQAHLRMAKAAADALGLREVRWVVTGRPEHKGAVASAQDRLEMVRLALTELGDPRMIADDREIRAAQAGRSNFTADTIAELQREMPQQPLVLLIGEDQLEAFITWSRWQWIVQQAKLAVCHRPGFTGAAAAKAIEQAGGAIHWVTIEPIELSSTSIRTAIAGGQTPAGLIPDSVARYIETHHLYRNTP